MRLQDFQDDLLEEVSQTFRRHRNVLMQSATGSGKTVMACAAAARAYARGRKVWFIVPRRELIRQTASTMARFNLAFSYIAAGFLGNPHARIHICSLQTLYPRLAKLEAPDLAIIDEAHLGSTMLDQTVKHLKTSGCFLLGLSATPWRASGEGLGKWFDHMVCGPSVRWLIENKHLSEYRMFAPSRPDLGQIKTVAGDYAKGQLAGFMEEQSVLIGDAVRHYRQNALGRLNLVYATSRKHSERVAEQFRTAGIPAMHIDGETPDDERRRVIRAFGRRELLTISSVDLITTGFDLGAQCGFDVTVEAMSDLRPTKSVALQFQKLGRVLRAKSFPAIIHDHSNNVFVHGLPDDPQDWTLEDRARGQGGASGERATPSRQCPKCFWVAKPEPQCGNCGHVFEVQSRELEHVEGDLAEVTEVDVKRARRQEQGMAKSADDLMKVGLARGMKPWNAKIWAERIVKAREQKQRGTDSLTVKQSDLMRWLRGHFERGGNEISLIEVSECTGLKNLSSTSDALAAAGLVVCGESGGRKTIVGVSG